MLQLHRNPLHPPPINSTFIPSNRCPTIMAPQQPVPNPILDPLDISPLPKPFKTTHWKPPARRNKNLKQILQEDAKANTAPTTTDAGKPTADSGAGGVRSPVGATYTNIESAPSFHPARAHWCDITGLPSRYMDPKTKLRYTGMEIYKAIQTLPPGSADGYLELRGANVVLK